ncbi:WLM-domain-containing protein [Schizopora paradoxa]|uniref:WLM-domain-containing protein n=1 Tax=Schizopora paradoxa TaxID=27342 RepID=A0A0H2RDJ9_9AGAM|nr:WLM-domain-containing protein [Schizopora paradoxa]
MVHHRINERETQPNKHINFITPLRMPQMPPPFSEEDARQLLRALAAQVRPIMKNHGFEVNSFEEYEYNRVFAGRNWEAGEVVELVLRNADGTFVSIPWLMSTLCHELAHIKHMNHGPDFQKLWAQLRREVKALQDKGYYGDGYWSSGTRLADSAPIGGQGVEEMDLPEYVCGGAQRRTRPKSMKRRRQYTSSEAGPSRKRRGPKPGARVRAKGKFKGEGQALNADISDEEEKKKGTGFRKQAGSKRAREERALAVEKRMRALQGLAAKEEDAGEDQGESSDTEHYSEGEEAIPETDENRLKTMRESMKDNDELNNMRQFMRQFLQENSTQKGKAKASGSDVPFIEIPSDDDGINEDCCIPSTSNPVVSKVESRDVRSPVKAASSVSRSESKNDRAKNSLQLGEMVKDEITFRRRESLGLVGERKLGADPSTSSIVTKEIANKQNAPSLSSSTRTWTCEVCTLDNAPLYVCCDACGNERRQ